MDTTNIYIKMCSKATEIQDIRKTQGYFDDGDFYANIKWDKSYRINIHSGSYGDILEQYIWLPRQDQLQDMIEGDLIDKLHRFNKMFVDRIIVASPNISKRSLIEFRQQWEKYIESGNKACIIASEEIKIEPTIIYPQLQSMEQMWLAFVMKENHNKQWSFETKKWEGIK